MVNHSTRAKVIVKVRDFAHWGGNQEAPPSLSLLCRQSPIVACPTGAPHKMLGETLFNVRAAPNIFDDAPEALSRQ